jgi:hypothetical protein
MIELLDKKTRHLVAVPILMSLLLAPLPSGAASEVDFKGIELGQPLWKTQERAVFGTLNCNPMQMSPEQHQIYLQELQQLMPEVRDVCAGSTSIAAVPAEVTVLLGAYRRVLRMTFQFASENYPQVLNAMTAKWGEGVAEVRDEFDESVWWDFDDGISISVHQTPDDADPNSEEDLLLIGLVEYSLPVSTPEGDL